MSRARSRADLTRLDVVAALRALVPWQVAGQLDDVVPERVAVPTGSRIRIDYTDPDVPTLSVRVQEVFGWAQAPLIAGRPLRLQLLSPAQRVVATTADLAGFWVTGYPAVRSELRGRYPRHPWPEDPAGGGAHRQGHEAGTPADLTLQSVPHAVSRLRPSGQPRSAATRTGSVATSRWAPRPSPTTGQPRARASAAASS